MMPSRRRRSVGRGRGRGRGTSLAFALALTLAALALVASDPFAGPEGVAASPPVAGPGLPAARPPSVGDRGRRGRRLEEVVVVVEDDHDHEHDHGHGDEGGAAEDDHDDHDHGAEEEDGDHEDHDHADRDHEGEEVDDHSGNDHSDHDHSDHDHSSATGSSESAAGDEKKPWGEVIGAALLVNVATLSGLFLLFLPAIQAGWLRAQGKDLGPQQSIRSIHGKAFDVCVPAFAVGALMATAVFLIFPEAMHLIEGAHDDHAGHDDHRGRFLADDGDDNEEGANAAKFGCSLLGGFLLPMIVSLFFPHSHDDDLDALEAHPKVAAKAEAEKLCDSTASKEVELGPAAATVTAAEEEVELGPVAATVTAAEAVPLAEEETAAGGAPAPASAAAATPAPAAPPINYRLMWTVLIGDGFHNLADGIFIGIAFLGCSSSLAWTITAVTIFHELVQELADFIILTRFCGLSVMRACVVNFLSGERTTSARDRGSGARFPLLLSL